MFDHCLICSFNEEFVKEAEAHLSTITVPQTKPSAQQPATSQAPQPAPKATMSIFRPNQDLKPAILEKECTYSECLHFIELWKNYMIAGYGSEDSIPQETLAIQLQPFINPTWWIQMTEMGIIRFIILTFSSNKLFVFLCVVSYIKHYLP